jgi:hypothetical protein
LQERERDANQEKTANHQNQNPAAIVEKRCMRGHGMRASPMAWLI